MTFNKEFAVNSAIALARYTDNAEVYKEFHDREEEKAWRDRADGARFLINSLTGVSVWVHRKTDTEGTYEVEYYRTGTDYFTTRVENVGRIQVARNNGLFTVQHVQWD